MKHKVYKGSAMFTIVLILMLSLVGTGSAHELVHPMDQPALNAMIYSHTYTLNADFEEGVLVGVEDATVPDQLQLSTNQVTLPFIWVPNQIGTVSKVNTETGKEIGRYWVTPHTYSQPSRTTVDLQGSAWVGVRVGGTVVKIGLEEAGLCNDRNGNSIIETSHDLNDNGDIDGLELLPFGQDECVLFEIPLSPGSEGPYVPGTNPYYDNNYWGVAPRGLAIDRDNNLWAGTWNSMKFYYINGATGAIMKTVDTGFNSYGAVIDRHGILWSAGLYGNLLRLDPNVDPPTISTMSFSHWAYGLGIDYLDHLFISSFTYNTLTRLDISSSPIVDWEKLEHGSGTRGVAVTSDNNVWIAATSSHNVYRYDNDGNLIATIPAGNGPTGVSVDAAGKVWACSLYNDTIVRIDPATNTVDLIKDLPGSGGHYTYSDMTGIIARNITTRIGTWTVDFDSGEGNTPWGNVAWTSDEPEGTSVTVRVRSSEDKISWSSWELASNGVPFGSIPNGRYLQIETTLQTLAGDVSPVLYDLTVNVANQPPTADADGPYSVQEDMTITLDGTGSSDPDGDLLTFDWDLDNDGIFETPGATPAFSRPDIGIYPVTLRVCDTFGACDTNTTEVYVTIKPGLFPPEFTAYVIAGESVTEVKTVNVPPRPPNADVIFSFDLTGSMYDIIGTAKARTADIINELDALSGVDIQYGVMSYMDYPHSYNSCGYADEYGTTSCGDYAYHLDQAVTDDAGAVVSAINALNQGCGSDGPQDYTRIFYESYADPNVDWRSGAKRVLVNFGDNVPHDCNLDEGVAGGIWSTGCDPGRDEIAGTGDDLDLQTVLADMASNGVVLVESHTTTNANAYWSYWTGLTGGHLFLTGSGTLVDDVVAAVESTLTAGMVNGLHLEAESPYESWLNTDALDVDPGLIGVSVNLDATFTVPPGTKPGKYSFTVYAVDENGVIYGEQEVTLIVLPPSMVTDSSLCTFDRAPEINGQQFRLIFTPDLQKLPAYKLPASNPGQFFYNVFYIGDGPVNLDISIPASFETQGANPVHIYGGSTVVAYADKICFVPDYENEIFAGTLANMPDELPGGFVHVAIHLDYALKGTTGYIPNSNKDALSAADGVTVLIPNLHNYTFSVSGSQTDSQTVQNVNEFKKIPGFGGLVMDGSNPVPGATVKIYINDKLLGSAITDQDGWYLYAYKYTGKAVNYKVVWSGITKTGTIKSNKFVEVNFP